MKAKTHLHEYVQHPRWATHYSCRVCGFAVAKPLSREGMKRVVVERPREDSSDLEDALLMNLPHDA